MQIFHNLCAQRLSQRDQIFMCSNLTELTANDDESVLDQRKILGAVFLYLVPSYKSPVFECVSGSG